MVSRKRDMIRQGTSHRPTTAKVTSAAGAGVKDEDSGDASGIVTTSMAGWSPGRATVSVNSCIQQASVTQYADVYS
jgi:hypothetical protein